MPLETEKKAVGFFIFFFFWPYPLHTFNQSAVYNVNMFNYCWKKMQDLRVWKELKNEGKLLAALQKFEIHKIQEISSYRDFWKCSTYESMA